MEVILEWVGHKFSLRNVDQIIWDDVTATLVFERGRPMLVSVDDICDIVW